MSEISIIPQPQKVVSDWGTVLVFSNLPILADSVNKKNAAYLIHLLSSLPRQNQKRIQTIHFILRTRDKSLGSEGYCLKITTKEIRIEAPTSTGVFYGIQTLRQLLPLEIEKGTPLEEREYAIPCLEITDFPRFAWRGFMLDEGRHFLGKEIVLHTLDLMALQKLNVFHWHLTEDQGWRIEIKKYPLLTTVGSNRAGTGTMIKGHHDGIPHGGFYTQLEIKEIVAYAADRHILIIPEIEMPGHSLAALASYPTLSCTGGPFEVATHYGIFPDIYCAGKEETFTFIKDVLTEVMSLFPSPYIHIGGDEAPKTRWKDCPECQRRIKAEDLNNEHELQVYFTNRIISWLAKRGRRVIGWNEIMQEGLRKDAVVQYWWGKKKKLIEEIRENSRDVIISTYLSTYLDHSHALTSLKDAYEFEPAFSELTEKESTHILGVEPPLWTEWIPNKARMDFQTYPRLTAFAETAWSAKEGKSYKRFRTRLKEFLKRLDALNVAYAGSRDVNPSILARLFKMFTIAIPQKKIARRK
jgi:hexosaminidase